MRKILWVCNTMLPEIFKRFGTYSVKEGWLIGISNELRKQKNIQLHYMCPQGKDERIVNITKQGIYFHCFYARYDDSYTLEESVRLQIEEIIKKIQPDIIHIFGTELPHALACVNYFEKKEKIIISIQGMVSEYAKFYLNGLPFRTYFVGGICGGKYQTIYGQYREFCKCANNEIRAIKGAGNVIGRTEWDRACVKKINSHCRYFYCSETLRNSFYDKEWDVNNCRRHTIFISQGNYPVKGLHNFLEALPDVVNKYMDTKVYIAGNNTFLRDGSPYGVYIRSILAKKKLEPYIFFLGPIKEDKMCEELLKAHVTVMPSNIENSPNSIGEAMLVGTPVIASFVGGIPSILKHETEGLLYQQNSLNMLSYYICKIFEDDKLASSISLNERKRAQGLYDKNNNLQQLLNIYNCI